MAGDESLDAMGVVRLFDSFGTARTVTGMLGLVAESLGCDAGVIEPGGKRQTASALRTTGPAGGIRRSVTLLSGEEVWLRFDDAVDGDFAELCLERFAVTCTLVLEKSALSCRGVDDPALIELLLSSTASETDRSRAVSLLGITPTAQVTAIAIDGSEQSMTDIARWCAKGATRLLIGTVGTLWAIIVVHREPGIERFDSTAKVGVGVSTTPTDLPTSWRSALNALRLSCPPGFPRGPRDATVFFANELGPFDLLIARLRPEDIVGVADIDVLDQLAEDAAGREMIRTLATIVNTRSVREAARQLHLHHNSVASRVERAEQLLGYKLSDPSGILRLTMAFTLQRLRDNHPHN